jgi:hypothetical protein
MSGETIEKNGFSVVAATRVTVRASTAPSNESCCVLENRWISSMNSTVSRPEARRSTWACSMTARTSRTPELSADICTNRRFVAEDTIRASVVLPLPGGPNRISDIGESPSTRRRNGEPAPSKCLWPITSSRDRGRIRAANGAFASSKSGALAATPAGGSNRVGPDTPSAYAELPTGRPRGDALPVGPARLVIEQRRAAA